MPTVTITSAHIQDALQYSPNPTFNYGTFPWEFVNSDQGITTIRWDLSQLPSGTITGFRMHLYRDATTGPGSGATVSIYKLKDTDTWVEGTHTGVQAVGQSCWNYAKYNTQAWHSNSGTNIDVGDADGSLITSVTDAGVNGYVTFTLTAALATSVNGLMMLSNTNGYDVYYNSKDAASNTPYLEIDYTPPPACPLPLLLVQE